MSDSEARIKLITSYGDGIVRNFVVRTGTLLGRFLSDRITAPLDSVSARVNGKSVSLFYELKDGDKVTAAPRSIRGAFATWTVARMCAWLESHGWETRAGRKKGKGDHVRYFKDDQSLTVNPDPNDRKFVDGRTMKKFARIVGRNVWQLVRDPQF